MIVTPPYNHYPLLSSYTPYPPLHHFTSPYPQQPPYTSLPTIALLHFFSDQSAAYPQWTIMSHPRFSLNYFYNNALSQCLLTITPITSLQPLPPLPPLLHHHYTIITHHHYTPPHNHLITTSETRVQRIPIGR